MSKRLHAACSLLSLVACATPACADEDAQLWLTTFADVHLSPDLRTANETIVRLSDDRRGLYEIENSLLFGIPLTEGVTVWAGYTYDPQFDAGRHTVTEHRAREQVTVDRLLVVGPLTLSGRMRAEQRWREGVSGTGWRVRPFMRLSWRVAERGRVTFNFSHEPFIDLDRTPFQTRAGLERMRNALFVHAALTPRLGLDLGYLNQHGFVSGGPDRSDHVATLSISYVR